MRRILLIISAWLALAGIAQAGDYQDGQTAGAAAAQTLAQELDTAEKINSRISQPLTSSGAPLQTFGDPAARQSFSAQLTSEASDSFLQIMIQPGATGDITYLAVRQDTDFDGSLDNLFESNSPISGVCANGVISCAPGTWGDCTYSNWTTDTTGRISMTAAPSIESLAGCYCINQSCGANLVWSNTDIILKDLGGAIVGAIQGNNPRFTVTLVNTTATTITYFGQDSSQGGAASATGAYQSGSTNPAIYYDPIGGILPTDSLIIAQSTDPRSYYSQMAESFPSRTNPTMIVECTVVNQIVFGDNDSLSIQKVDSCAGKDLSGCTLRTKKVCDQAKKNCVATVDYYDPTGLASLESCQQDNSRELCANGNSIYQSSPTPVVTLASGLDSWWYIFADFKCPITADYSTAAARTAADNVANSTAFDESTGLAVYTDLDAVTRTISTNPEYPAETCEMACEIQIAAEDTEASVNGTTADYRRVVTTTENQVRNCVDGTCPRESSEVLIKDCACLNSFAETTSILQTLSNAGKSTICSSKN